jgi:ribose transport system permease protein
MTDVATSQAQAEDSAIMPASASPTMPVMKWGERVRWTAFAPYVGLVVILLLWYAKLPQAFTLLNLNTQILAATTLAVAAAAQTIVIQAREIDLSIAWVISLTTSVFATRGVEGVAPTVAWMVVLVGLGVVCGVLNGLVIAYLRLQSFVVTLATWSILSGVALLILPQDGGAIPSWYVTGVATKVLGLSVGVWFFIGLAVCGAWFARLRLGTAVRAIGSDRTSAFLSGVPTGRTVVTTFAISGGLASTAGLFLTSQTASGSASAGDPYILTSIAAVVIGGTSLAGGRGGVGGSLVGAVIVTVIASVIFAYQLSSFWTPLLVGVLLIASVVGGSAIDALTKRGS